MAPKYSIEFLGVCVCLRAALFLAAVGQGRLDRIKRGAGRMVPRKPKLTDVSMTVVTFLWHIYHSCAEGMPNRFRLDKARAGLIGTRF